MSVVLISILTLVGLGVASALVLYMASKKFQVFEDPRIDQVEEVLPKSNCGGCGFPGCRAFAEALVKSDDFSDLKCPVGGSATMTKVSEILGKAVADVKPQLAGTLQGSTAQTQYMTVQCHVQWLLPCTVANRCCTAAWVAVTVLWPVFDAMYMDEATGLPVVIEENCVACGKCVELARRTSSNSAMWIKSPAL